MRLIILMTIGLYGCATPVRELQPPVDLVWPGGEEIPRILFIGSVSKPQDFRISQGVFQRFWGYLIGRKEESLVAPYGITVDPAGRMYVVDTFHRKIHLFDVAAGEFHVIPEGEERMTSPIDIVVDDATGRIYVTDSKDAVIKVFEDVDDTTPRTIGGGLLKRPTGLAISRFTGELLVVDTKLSSVFRFDLNSYQLKERFGAEGTAQGLFNHPTNIAVDQDGSILITDALNFRIQRFSGQGEFRETFGSVGDSPGHFARPRGIATDSDGNIYVVDALFDNIQIFDKTGRLLMAFGTSGREYGQFWLPAGICIDRDDKIYVADSYNKRIQLFQYLKQEDSLP
jgi:DNA-binding beta-propeller fold protein YncE